MGCSVEGGRDMLLINASRNFFLTCVAILLLFLWSFCAGASQLTQFPSDVLELPSPSGRFTIVNIDSEFASPNHALLLWDTRTQSVQKLFPYDRSVEVAWSPRGTSLFLNDHGGSDYTNCHVFSFDNDGSNRKAFNVTEQLKKATKENKGIFGNHHIYIEAVSWIDEQKILIRASGYGDVNAGGFCFLYEYAIKKNNIKFLRKCSSQDNE